jgi:hypothetical protein
MSVWEEAFTTADTERTEEARRFECLTLCVISVRSVSAVVNASCHTINLNLLQDI